MLLCICISEGYKIPITGNCAEVPYLCGLARVVPSFGQLITVHNHSKEGEIWIE